MRPRPGSDLRDVAALHGAFFALSAALLAAPLGLATGWRIGALTLLYVVALPLLAHRRGHHEWIDLWLFLVPLSALQVLPDWFLSAVLGVLVFPDDGSPRIGTVCAYMAGLWIIPLFLVVRGARAIERGRPAGAALRGPLLAALLALLVFGAAEATSHRLLGSWYARDVWMVGDVAVYVLAPEALLGLMAYVGAEQSEGRSFAIKAAVAGGIALAYTGALALSYMFVEGRAFPS